MTRDEHLVWAKTRALAYLPDDPSQAVASMSSDLSKHKDFQSLAYTRLAMLGILAIMDGPDAVQRWIEGFN